MTEDELRAVLKVRGWTLRRARRAIDRSYFYAVRRIPKSRDRKEILICRTDQVEQQKEEDIVAKLFK